MPKIFDINVLVYRNTLTLSYPNAYDGNTCYHNQYYKNSTAIRSESVDDKNIQKHPVNTSFDLMWISQHPNSTSGVFPIVCLFCKSMSWEMNTRNCEVPELSELLL